MQLCNMKNIKTIIFDLGAVILNISYKNTIDAFAKLGIPNSESFYSKQVQTDLFNQIETGKISEKKFFLELQKKTSKTSITELKDAWNAMLLDLPKKRIDLLKRIKPHYSIFLLSNTNSIHISELKKKLGKKTYYNFYNLFNKVYYSHKIGFRKPSQQAFKIILEENKLYAHECLFIDDSPQHVQGAKKLGIKTHHLQENEELTTLFPHIIQ